MRDLRACAGFDLARSSDRWHPPPFGSSPKTPSVHLHRAFFLIPLVLARGASPLAAEPVLALAQDPATEARDKAKALERDGALAEASQAWIVAGLAVPPGAARDDCVSRSRALDMRVALRREIADAFPRRRAEFGELGLSAATIDSVTTAERTLPWIEAPIELLRKCARLAKASQQARAGLELEALARGSAAEKDQALVAIAKLVEKQELKELDAFAAIARARNEPVPARGYVFEKGKWKSTDAVAKAAQDEGEEAIAVRLEEASAAQRDEAYRAARALGPGFVPRLRRALETRLASSAKAIEQGNVLHELEALAAQRTELDLRRKAALDLIFDEETYFYPYAPPACPPEKAKLYAGVQQKVDELVARVRETWKATRRVRPPKEMREALVELAWLRAREELRPSEKAVVNGAADGNGASTPDVAPVTWPALPDWIWGLDPTLDAIDLGSFAWSMEERLVHARDRAVLAENERRYASNAYDSIHRASTDEQRQIAITNDYRLMLGRCAVAWNPKLQGAAQLHSEYMANSGDFGHDERDPKRATPNDRVKLEGYPGGTGENCAMNEGAESAHVGWLHSSGHHRNILEAAHKELGSAVAGLCWTQNFGDVDEVGQELARAARK